MSGIANFIQEYQVSLISEHKLINEMIMKNKILSFVKTTQFWVIICAIGIWAQFLHTLLSSEGGVQTVYVTGGTIDTDISSTVEVEGSVSIDNRVDVNLSAINGYRNCFYNSYSKHPNDYYRIPVAEY